MFHFLETTGAAGGADLMSTLIMMAVMVGVFYFMLIRPENKRKKEADEMRASLKVGDDITTIGGIVGKIVDVKGDNIVLETGADRVRIEFVKWAVSTNESAAARAAEAQKAEAKKAQEAKAKAKAAKKAEKEKK